MTEITLNDGRIFNSRFSEIDRAIPDIADYLFCEYNEILNLNNIMRVTIIERKEFGPYPFRTGEIKQ